MENKNEMRIDIGNGNFLVVNIYRSDSPKNYPDEISVTVEKEGNVVQDICLVRQAYVKEDGSRIPDTVECLLWEDKYKEDYTCVALISVLNSGEDER